MTSASQWPSRPGGSEVSGPLRADDSGHAQVVPPPPGARGYADIPAVNAFCLEALDGALELVRADGGEVAALDFAATAMVTRARRKRPPHLPGFGSAARPSQPVSSSGIFEAPDPIDSQVTQVMPSAQMARAYAPNQGLVGAVWARREAMQIRFDEHTIGAAGSMLVEADAPHHLAVPIFRPETLNHLGGRGPVIGVLRVFNRDQLWSYSAHDRVLLELHADRLGRALALLDTSADSVRRGDVIGALRDLSGVGPTLRDLLTRVAEIAARQMNAQSFTALFLEPGAPDTSANNVRVELALRAGIPLPGGMFSSADLPQWLQRAFSGDLVRESAPQGGSATVLDSLGWAADNPMRSAVAAPLVSGGRIGGVLVIASPTPDAFTAEAAALFEALTLAAATFVENARLVEGAQRSVARLAEQRQQLSALNNATQTLNASLDVAATLQALAQQASLLTSAKVCAVFLREDGSDALVCRAVFPESEVSASLLEARIPLDWRKVGNRLTEGTFVLEEGVMPASLDSDTATATLARVGVTSFLAAPISHQDRHLGALVIYTPRQSHHFSPDEIGLLQGLASQAAIAISNARLYAELEGAYEQLKELDRLKDDFILTVSHEFRTPLTAIEGYVTLINKHGHKLDQEKLQQFAGEIHQATIQLAGMISMLADANRLSTQPLRISPRPLNLSAAARDAAGAQAPEAKDHIHLRIADDLWVNGDDERLPLVFSNLVSNAIKYAGADKPCRVSARLTPRKALAAEGRKLSTPGDDEQEWVVVTVEDEGPGISVEDQARLFQKFVRLAQSLVTPVRGTGLGLWICRQYVEAMGGDIWVNSRPGQGARFSFCLPRIPAPAS